MWRGKILILILILFFVGGFIMAKPHSAKAESDSKQLIKLPEPAVSGKMSLEETIKKRRSIRRYKKEALTPKEVSQLLWSVQGITDPSTGMRSAPSAGATYPLEIYIAIGNVFDIPQGLYKYRPAEHALLKIKDGDVRKELAQAALGQDFLADAGVVIGFAAVFDRTTGRYGERGRMYVHMEIGHASENVYLQAVSLGLGTVAVGAFREGDVAQALNLPKEEVPLYLMPVGRT